MIINLFCMVLSLLFYLFAPVQYSFSYILLVSSLFLFQTIFFGIRKSEKTYINFYNLFFVSYFFINFFYPLVLYPIDPEYFSIFSKKFNHSVINEATALAQLSSSALILGATAINKKIEKKENKSPYYFSHLPVTILATLLFLLFIATVGGEFLSGNFTGQSAISLYILPLVICSYTLATIIFFRDYDYQKNKFFFFFSIMMYIGLFLSVGDRGPALSIILIIFALYSQYVEKLKIIYVFPLAILGVFLMRLIGEGRTSSVTHDNQNIISRGIESLSFSMDGYYEMTLDFVINSWTLYVGVEYVTYNGVNWGQTFLKPVLGVVPFLQGLVESTNVIKLTSPAEIFTQIGLGDNATWGLGTNLISSIYISFGAFGCVFLFFILGFIVEKNRIKIYENSLISPSIIYFTLLSFSIYYPRTDLMMPLKFILWTYVIYVLLRNFKILSAKFK